jgi:hypothetical protein
MKTHSQVNIAEIASIINNIPGITAVQIIDNQVLATSKDRDQEIIVVVVNESDDNRLICNVPLQVPDHRYVDSLLVTNTWNRLNHSLDTYAYVSIIADSPFILLESYCLLIDGVNSKNITIWLQNLIGHINSFEELVVSRLCSTEQWLKDKSLR